MLYWMTWEKQWGRKVLEFERSAGREKRPLLRKTFGIPKKKMKRTMSEKVSEWGCW